MEIPVFPNPFRPGAGHAPPYLAGRDQEKISFTNLLGQTVILKNLVLTGLRGVGKTVLLDSFKPLAIKAGWLWSSTDLSESASVNEENLAIRIMADLAPLLGDLVVGEAEQRQIGFYSRAERQQTTLTYPMMRWIYEQTPGLVSDKLKRLLEFAWQHLQQKNVRGIILAYDEAQNLSDRAEHHQFPLSLLLDVFQSLQKKGVPFMLLLTGLPTLYPKLVAARTFAERLFTVMTLSSLSKQQSRDAVLEPVLKQCCPITFSDETVDRIIEYSGGYPYFIQFLARETFDFVLQRLPSEAPPIVPVVEILRKLDADFYAGRWSRISDRQRDLLMVIATLENCDIEFGGTEVAEQSQRLACEPFTSSYVIRLLSKLADSGLIYKNRHGRYCFAVPLLGQFINRQREEANAVDLFHQTPRNLLAKKTPFVSLA